jgi:AcrR family transcriptional regulator
MPTQSGSSSRHDWGTEARLLEAVTSVVTRHGYANLTVQKILSAAAVSRATFYQYFSNVDDCFQNAYRQHAVQLVAEVELTARRSDQPELAMLDVLVDTAISRPDVARMLLTEALAAGPLGVRERDTLIAAIAGAITDSVPPQSRIDLPTGILIGGAFRFLSMRLTDGDLPDSLRDDVREWASVFTRRSSQPSWHARLAPALPRHPPRSSPTTGLLRPSGKPRERILRASAALVRERGYRGVTVADIVATAGVSRRLFYNEFASKADAFIAAYELAFERTVAACTPAFFSSGTWPERVWLSGQAFTGFLAREPLFAYLGFVECYAIGPGFVPRVHDTQLMFTFFLEEGYRQRSRARSLSRSCGALAATTIFELAFQGSRRGTSSQLRRLQPLAVYIALAPFIGPDAAGAFVTSKVSETRSSAPAAARAGSTRVSRPASASAPSRLFPRQQPRIGKQS